MTIVSVLLAISAAVVIPKWQQSLERTKVAGMQRAVESDIAYLRRHSVRRGCSTTVTFTTGTAALKISPPLPNLLGDSGGLVNYADRFPGVKITQADFDGFKAFGINQFGELTRNGDAARLSVGRLTFDAGTTSKTSDILVAR